MTNIQRLEEGTTLDNILLMGPDKRFHPAVIQTVVPDDFSFTDTDIYGVLGFVSVIPSDDSGIEPGQLQPVGGLEWVVPELTRGYSIPTGARWQLDEEYVDFPDESAIRNAVRVLDSQRTDPLIAPFAIIMTLADVITDTIQRRVVSDLHGHGFAYYAARLNTQLERDDERYIVAPSICADQVYTSAARIKVRLADTGGEPDLTITEYIVLDYDSASNGFAPLAFKQYTIGDEKFIIPNQLQFTGQKPIPGSLRVAEGIQLIPALVENSGRMPVDYFSKAVARILDRIPEGTRLLGAPFKQINGQTAGVPYLPVQHIAAD